MTDSRPEELLRAEELMDNGKLEEAHEIIVNFEKTSQLTPKDRLSALLIKGWIYGLNFQLRNAIKVGELAYPLSQELGLVPESIEALLLKAYIGRFDPDNALNIILEAEKLLNSLSDESSVNIEKLKLALIYLKSIAYNYKTNFDIALDFAMEALTLGKKIKNHVMVGYCLASISFTYWQRGEYDNALEYATQCLKLNEKLDFQVGVAYGLFLMGQIYSIKGELNRALEVCKKSLSIEKISNITKIHTFFVLGRTYKEKGELNKALKYAKQAIKLAEETSYYLMILINNRIIGEIYMMKGEKSQAKYYFEQCFVHSEKSGYNISIVPAFLCLLLINLENNSPEQAHKYLNRLKDLSDQIESTLMKHGYPLGKALMLKASSRMADHTDAARLLKKIVDDDILWPQFHILAIVSLCELLLEELSIYNNPEVVDEINPLILQILNVAENQHSFSWLAEGKLLQAKLSLIQMDLEKAKILLTQAQKIAEEHGLDLLAQKISSEHDSLLEKVDEWDILKKKDAPMAERIDLASIDGVINRLQGKQAVDPPELVEEEPILLLIMDNSGIPYFNHTFVSDWDSDGLFSSFMSAFNTFSSELFSKSIDRIRIGDNVILINPIEPFLACYVIKGQSYPALQKLTRFTYAIRENTEIWQALNKSVKTSEILELDKPPALKTVINEIFTQ